jgi:hypothetical protein
MRTLSTPSFSLFREDRRLFNILTIVVLTAIFYSVGAMLRLVEELSLFWPLNGVMAGVFARYVWLNRLHYYAVCYLTMLGLDALTTEWGTASLVINLSNMVFIVVVAMCVVRDKNARTRRRARSMPSSCLRTVWWAPYSAHYWARRVPLALTA